MTRAVMEENILVYDLGSGTFGVSFLTIDTNRAMVCASLELSADQVGYCEADALGACRKQAEKGLKCCRWLNRLSGRRGASVR